jgi:hypothetical protein
MKELEKFVQEYADRNPAISESELAGRIARDLARIIHELYPELPYAPNGDGICE